jgi:hypothetical protein
LNAGSGIRLRLHGIAFSWQKMVPRNLPGLSKIANSLAYVACDAPQRYSTPWSFKHFKNSLKSLVNDLGSIIQFAQDLGMLEVSGVYAKAKIHDPHAPHRHASGLGTSFDRSRAIVLLHVSSDHLESLPRQTVPSQAFSKRTEEKNGADLRPRRRSAYPRAPLLQ